MWSTSAVAPAPPPCAWHPSSLPPKRSGSTCRGRCSRSRRRACALPWQGSTPSRSRSPTCRPTHRLVRRSISPSRGSASCSTPIRRWRSSHRRGDRGRRPPRGRVLRHPRSEPVHHRTGRCRITGARTHATVRWPGPVQPRRLRGDQHAAHRRRVRRGPHRAGPQRGRRRHRRRPPPTRRPGSRAEPHDVRSAPRWQSQRCVVPRSTPPSTRSPRMPGTASCGWQQPAGSSLQRRRSPSWSRSDVGSVADLGALGARALELPEAVDRGQHHHRVPHAKRLLVSAPA